MLDGKEAKPENGTCPEPDEELAPLSKNQPEEKKIEMKTPPPTPPPHKKKINPNWNRKCNLQDFQNNP